MQTNGRTRIQIQAVSDSEVQVFSTTQHQNGLTFRENDDFHIFLLEYSQTNSVKISFNMLAHFGI